MSSYRDFTTCVIDIVEKYRSYIKTHEVDTIREFFNYGDNMNYVNDLVVTYHDEILNSFENSFLTDDKVPAGIISLAKKQGVIFPRGFSIKDDEQIYDVFLMRIKDYREARGLTKKRVKEIRDQNYELTKRVRMQ